MFDSGIEFLNLPALDPFFLEKINVTHNAFFISVDGAVKNITVEGLKNFTLESIFFDPETLIFNSTTKIPRIHLSADYDVKGRILVFSLPGIGNFHVNLG